MVLVPKRIDNSQVVREVDPRSSRHLWALFLLVALLVGALALYAWPHVQLRELELEEIRMSRQKERLVEKNRKLRLEKASLEELRRIEEIATSDLGLLQAPAQRVVIIESSGVVAEGGQLARAGSGREARH
jgi:cell division protein FtsL